MKTIYTSLLFALITLTLPVASQTATEAYRLSVSDPLGTARNLGTGNSMFAIGPDFSAIGSNPAGLAGFWKSEFTITMGGQFNQYASSFTDDRSRITDGNYNIFTLPNIGFVLSSRQRNSKWITSNWAAGYNRMAEYRRETNYSGSTLGSMTDSWRENAFGLTSEELNGFEEGLAWTSGAIYDFEEDRIYESDYSLSPEYRLFKQEDASLEGGKSELFLGYAANYDNKFLIGASFNIPLVNYTEYRDYVEVDGSENGVPFFNDLQYTSYVNSTGSGVNGKFGMTYKPNKNFNISFAAHTPTKLFMTDNYNTTVAYDYTDANNNGPIYSASPYGSFRYAMVTPWSLMGGIGIIVGEQGFIGASLKWTDYGAMHFDYSVNGNGYYYEEEEQEVNQAIRANYGSVLDINVGGEFVLSAIRLRGGVSLAQSPYLNDNNFDPAYHAGIGFRTDAFYIDFGYKWVNLVEGYQPYETTDAPQPLVQVDNNRHTIAGTVGMKF
jgi:hypothetical protein